jgi:uncharacterized protein CbrC (UPF0167 family)
VLAAFNALTRERDAAREELRDLNEAWCVLNDSHIALRAERDEARVVTDAMVERVARVILSRRVSYTGKNAEKAWLWYGNDFKHEAREYLTAALSEAT